MKLNLRCCREEGVAIWTVIGMERIHVSVRAKPLSQDDAKTTPWRIFGNSIAIPNLSKFDFGTLLLLSLHFLLLANLLLNLSHVSQTKYSAIVLQPRKSTKLAPRISWRPQFGDSTVCMLCYFSLLLVITWIG